MDATPFYNDNGTWNLLFTKLDPNATIPTRATAQSAGMDLTACCDDVTIEPGARMLIPTGLSMAMPPGYEAQIRPRSGLALKHGITVLNSPGTVDADYRGPVGVILINHGTEPFAVKSGDRIAQMVLNKIEAPRRVIQVPELPSTERGQGGFGSTGV